MKHYHTLVEKFEKQHRSLIAVPICLYASIAILAYLKAGSMQYMTVLFGTLAVILACKLYIVSTHNITVTSKSENSIVIKRDSTPAWYRQRITHNLPLLPHTLVLIAGPMIFGLATMHTTMTYQIAHRYILDEGLSRSNDQILVTATPKDLLCTMPHPAIIVTKHLYNKSFFTDIISSFFTDVDRIKFIFGVKVYAFRAIPKALFNGYAIPKSGYKSRAARHKQHDEMLNVVKNNTSIFFPSGWSPTKFSATAALLAFASGVPMVFAAPRLRNGHIELEHVLIDGKTRFEHTSKYIRQAQLIEWPPQLEQSQNYSTYRKEHHETANRLMRLWFQWFTDYVQTDWK